MSPASTLVFVLAAVYAADALPGGAPQSACDNLTPSHSGIAAQTSAVPYSIDLLPFADGSGGYQYTPGTTYTVTISGNNEEMFRGFLVQSRLAADDTTRVGVFATVDPNTRLSFCSPNTDGVTHDNGGRIDFTSRSMQWTAPAQGTGDIRFAFAVVEVFSTFWANQRSATVSEEPAAPTTEPTESPTPEPATPEASVTPTVGTPQPTETPTAQTTPTTDDTIPTVTVRTEPPSGPTNTTTTPTTMSEAPSEMTDPTASASGVLVSVLSILLAVMATLLL